jgi:hypothetical protein
VRLAAGVVGPSRFDDTPPPRPYNQRAPERVRPVSVKFGDATGHFTDVAVRYIAGSDDIFVARLKLRRTAEPMLPPARARFTQPVWSRPRPDGGDDALAQGWWEEAAFGRRVGPSTPRRRR